MSCRGFAAIIFSLGLPKNFRPSTAYSTYRFTATRPFSSMNNMQRRDIVVDTDGGFDDLFALTMLLGSPSVNLKLITTVHGMTDPELAAKTIRRMLFMFGYQDEVKVVAGAKKADECEHSIYDYSWGRDYVSNFKEKVNQLGLPALPDDDSYDYIPCREKAVNALVEALTREKSSDGAPVTLLCLGSLTNIQASMPGLLKSSTPASSRELIVMGGAVHCPGNCATNKAAEFNLHMNPKASHSVFANSKEVFQSISLADLSTANENHRDYINKFIQNIAATHAGDKNLMNYPAHKFLSSLISAEPLSSTYDPIAATFFLNPDAIESVPTPIDVCEKTGVTSPVENMENHPSATIVSLGTKLHVDKYLQTIKNIMLGESATMSMK